MITIQSNVLNFIIITRHRVITTGGIDAGLLISEVGASGPGLRDKCLELRENGNGTRKAWEEVFVEPETDYDNFL
jgi:hypothetical protein